jgi:hypothetical protein
MQMLAPQERAALASNKLPGISKVAVDVPAAVAKAFLGRYTKPQSVIFREI